FGVGLNYTHTGSEARGVSRGFNLTTHQPVLDKVPLFFQSPTVGTVQLFYEKYGFTGRLAYSLRDAYLDTVGSDRAHDLYTDFNGQLDGRASYDILPNLQVFMDATNLNDATWRRYQGNHHQTVETERYSWTWRTGLTFKY